MALEYWLTKPKLARGGLTPIAVTLGLPNPWVGPA
ncbi:MAG: hypothetical protein BWX84_02173 [Verrucomicrobia bacterium ADurb.Bin118]|nr:MAG: hypothetical protein BWX84_02173 [Verrucomicrobia bacterium ADurb.Bin118]